MRPICKVGIGLLIIASVVAIRAHADDGSREDAAVTGVLARIEALELQSRADSATISEQSKLIATLQQDLKTAKEDAAKESTDAKSELLAQIKANRKEVYADIVTIVDWHNYPQPFPQEPHHHFEKARQDGYVAGLPNGHSNDKAIGSIRWMPIKLAEKCKQIAESN